MTQHFLFIGSAYTPLMNQAYELIDSFAKEEDVFVYDLTTHAFSDIYEDLLTPPLFTDKKVLLIKHFEEALQDDTYVVKMESYFKNPNPDVFLIGISAHKEASKSWHKLIDLYVETIEVQALNEVDIEKYIKKTLKSSQIEINMDTLHLLTDRLTLQKDFVESQLAKLVTFVMDKHVIEKEDVFKMIELPLEDNVFLMIQKFMQKDIRSVLNIYHDLLLLSEDPIRIMNAFAKKLSQIEDIKHYMHQGLDQRKISEALHISHGQAYYLIKEAKTLHEDDIKSYLNALATLDYEIKSGKIDKKIGLEIFLMGVRHE